MTTTNWAFFHNYEQRYKKNAAQVKFLDGINIWIRYTSADDGLVVIVLRHFFSLLKHWKYAASILLERKVLPEKNREFNSLFYKRLHSQQNQSVGV